MVMPMTVPLTTWATAVACTLPGKAGGGAMVTVGTFA